MPVSRPTYFAWSHYANVPTYSTTWSVPIWDAREPQPSVPPEVWARHPAIPWTVRERMPWPHHDTHCSPATLWGEVDTEVLRSRSGTFRGWPSYMMLQFKMQTRSACADLADKLLGSGHGPGLFFYGDTMEGHDPDRDGDSHLAWYIPIEFAASRAALSRLLNGIAARFDPIGISISRPASPGRKMDCLWLVSLSGRREAYSSWLSDANSPSVANDAPRPLADVDPRDWPPGESADRGCDHDPNRLRASLTF